MEMEIVNNAIDAVANGKISFCKFLSANDTGLTGGHQSGIYIEKNSIEILFDEPGKKGENKDKWVKICWQNDFETDSRFIYYGIGTRNEYRITNFKRGFPFLKPEYTGALFVLVKCTEEDYSAYVLGTDDEITSFLDAFGISPADTGNLINKENVRKESLEELEFSKIIRLTGTNFPESKIMSENACKVYQALNSNNTDIINDPDGIILRWTVMEYRLFRYYEYVQYENKVKQGFASVDEFVKMANEVLNRRKSRAGKSLENHLTTIFDANEVMYSAQPHTEGNKKPDFIFPSIEDYHNMGFEFQGLTYLGAKTTCKDRWRQILNEANRIPVKHLFTLQQGISPQQLDEMKEENVILVVPQSYISTYPKDKREIIINLKSFLGLVKERQDKRKSFLV